MGRPKRDSRDTARFDPTPLAELSKQEEPDVRLSDTQEIARSRTVTVHDPLTTSLLAETSRQSQPAIELDGTAEETPADKVTPHVRRRR